MSLDPTDLDFATDSPNPLDMVEAVLTTYNLDYIRMADDELALSVAGQCASYRLVLTWQDEYEALQIVCQYPMHMVCSNDATIAKLLMTANAQLWLGHFERVEEGQMQFRYTTLLRGPAPDHGVDQMNDLLKLAVAECDRFLPALNMLRDDGAALPQDLAFAMQDTIGES
jgi:hypothetical protein